MNYYYLKKDENGSLRSVKIDKLLNCPFCGSDVLEMQQQMGDSGYTVVNCNNCGCQGPIGIVPIQAETLWNSRTAEKMTDTSLADNDHS